VVFLWTNSPAIQQIFPPLRENNKLRLKDYSLSPLKPSSPLILTFSRKGRREIIKGFPFILLSLDGRGLR